MSKCDRECAPVILTDEALELVSGGGLSGLNSRFGFASSSGGDIGKNADVTMVNLQSLVSQRGTAVQVCTNIISKLDQTENSITQNIKS